MAATKEQEDVSPRTPKAKEILMLPIPKVTVTLPVERASVVGTEALGRSH